MKNGKRIIALLLSILMLACVLCSCVNINEGDGSTSTSSTISTGATETVRDDIQSAIDSTVASPDIDSATTVEPADSGVTTITSGGTYIFDETVKEGRIIVNAPKQDVTIILAEADITCSYGSPIYVYKASAVTIYLKEGTTNILTDGSTYTYADEYSSSEKEEPNACLYSKADITIAGAGTLTVNANNNNGITSKRLSASRRKITE